MDEQKRKERLAQLEKEWQETYRKIRNYRILLKCTEERLEKITREINKL